MGICCGKNNKIEDESKQEAIVIAEKEIKEAHETSFEFDVNEWKLLVNKLQENKKLEDYALSVNRTQFEELNELIQFLSRYDCKNEFEKAWLIYVWIANNIAYNVNGFRTGDYGANDSVNVLETGHCVCEGYASLFVDLSTGLGLKCKKITGYAKGFGYQIGEKFKKMNHAWNVIMINNKYYFIESTWGAGTCSEDFKFIKKFNPYWFCTPAQVFIYTHYTELFQLQTKKITLKEYENMPVFGLQYHLFELQCLTHSNSSVICSMHTPLVIEFAAKKNVLLIADLKKGPYFKEIIDNSVLVQRDAISKNYALIVSIPDKNKNFKLNLYAKYEKSQSELFENVTSFLVSRTKDDLNLKIPKYTLIYDNDIKCESHHCEFIQAQKNPIDLIFSVPINKSMIGDLRKDNGDVIKNSVMIQRSLDQSKYEIKVLLPLKNEFYELNLFSKKTNTSTYEFLAKFRMTREQNQVDNDQIKFISIYQNELIESYIFKPVEYNLKLNKVYLFKVYLKNVYKVALVDINSNWIYLENLSDSIWSIEKSFNSIGEITLFVKTASTESNFEAICSYFIG